MKSMINWRSWYPFAPDDATLPTDDRLAIMLANYDLIDQFRLRLWEVPPQSAEQTLTVHLKRPDDAALDLVLRLEGDGWRLVMRGLRDALNTTKSLAAMQGERPRGPHISARVTMQHCTVANCKGLQHAENLQTDSVHFALLNVHFFFRSIASTFSLCKIAREGMHKKQSASCTRNDMHCQHEVASAFCYHE